MKRKVLISIVVSVSMLLVLSFPGLLQAFSGKAPPFTLKDIDGNTVSLSDYRGKIVIIDFWATWCHECEDSSPELDRVYRKYRDRGVIFLGISLDEGGDAIELVRKFIKKFNITFPILMGDRKLANAYYIKGIPTTYVLDKDHNITARFEGALAMLGALISEEIEKIH
ncbi:MAG: TlpA disulfide reductase family protein [Thermodesulfovibrionales bacterium]